MTQQLAHRDNEEQPTTSENEFLEEGDDNPEYVRAFIGIYAYLLFICLSINLI